MKFKKVFAGILAGAMVAGMAVPVFAAKELPLVYGEGDGVEVKDLKIENAWDSQWVKLYGLADLDLEDAKLVYSVTVMENPGWDGFTVANVYKDADTSYASFVGKADQDEYVFTSDVIPELDEWGGIGFNIQAGHAPIVVNSIKLVLAEEESSEEETSSEEASSEEASSEATSSEEASTDEASKVVENAEYFGVQVYAMGVETWNWKSVVADSMNKDGTVVLKGDAAKLAEESGDKAIGDTGVQFFLGDAGQAELLKDGSYVTADFNYTLQDASGKVVKEGKLSIDTSKLDNGKPATTAGDPLYGYNEDWAKFTAIGEFTLTGTVSNIVVHKAEATEEATAESTESTTSAVSDSDPSGDTAPVVVLAFLAVAALGTIVISKRVINA